MDRLSSELRTRHFEHAATEPEIELPAGDVTEGVVRVGNTVRRPHQPQSYAVAAYLDHLETVGFDASPRFLGRDSQGRDVLTFLEGDVAEAKLEPWVLADRLLVSVALLVRRLHDASIGYQPLEHFPPSPFTLHRAELVTHLDVTPQNVVTNGGEATGLIDFDLAGPSTRLIDSLNAAMHWVPLRDPVDLDDVAVDIDQFARLRLFADAYGWQQSEREALPRFAAARATASWRRMKFRAENDGGGWARMWSEGVGDLILRRRAWLLSKEPAILRALLN